MAMRWAGGCRRAGTWTVLLAAGYGLLTGCGASTTTSEEAIATFALTNRAGINTYAVVPDQLRLAAAQVFRDVSARAVANPLPRLRLDVRDALYAEKGVHGSLAPDTQRRILPLLAKLDVAAKRGDRTVVADCARESVRLIAEDMSPAADKQAAFILLDYAQLTAAAALGSPHTNWRAVDAAIKLAAPRQLALANQPGSPDTKTLDNGFAQLAEAADRHDRGAAADALRRLRKTFDTYRLGFDSPLPDQALASRMREKG